MRILGLLFIGLGLLLCLTVLFAGAGLPMIGVGALLCIAGHKRGLEPVQTAPGGLRRAAIALSILLAALLLSALVYRLQPSEANPAAAQMSSEWQKAFSTPQPHTKPAKASRGR